MKKQNLLFKFHPHSIIALLTGIILAAHTPARAAESTGVLPKTPPGPHFSLSAKAHDDAPSFRANKPVVGTTYFYWYDAPSKTHILNGDGSDALTDHPVDLATTSYKSEAWHERQMRDIRAAGVDFLMPVFWGVPGQYEKGRFAWSFQGLPPLVAAHDALIKKGETPPAIALFYDTSILQHNNFNKNGSTYHVDLQTDFGKAWFYTAMRDFWSLIPPAKWARVDGRPIVFLYSAHYAKRQDPAIMDYVRRRFREDFAAEPFIVKHLDWLGPADATYGWGGAVTMQLHPRVAALGPGYDHSAVPGRSPLIAERKNGKTYTDRWRRLLSLNPERRPWMVHVETWNEWHEGTDIAESKEYGRQYIDLTRRYADMWRSGAQLTLPGPYKTADQVVWNADAPRGLTPRPSSGDGCFEIVDGAIVTRPNPHSSSRFLYFNVDDSFIFDGVSNGSVEIDITYRATGRYQFMVEYDNADLEQGEVDGAFRDTLTEAGGPSDAWKTATFPLPQARFIGRANGADFRLSLFGGNLAVRQIVLRKVSRR